MVPLRRIDSHNHFIPKFYVDACTSIGAIPARGPFPDWSAELALDLMDANDIEVAVTSLVPGVHFFPPEDARKLARRCNDFAAGLCARFPRRFGAFGTIPMHDPKEAVKEIEYACDVLKLDGVCLTSNYGGQYLGDPVFDPVLSALNDRSCVVFIHPYHAGRHLPGSPASSSSLTYPSFMIEYPFDTTRLGIHLILTGAVKRFPEVRFILPHAGGTLPWMAWRLYVSPMVSPHDLPETTYEELRTQLGHFWYDTALSAGPEMLGCLRSVVGDDHVIFGSDWPMAPARAVAQCVSNLSKPDVVPDSLRAAYARKNALALFPRFAE